MIFRPTKLKRFAFFLILDILISIFSVAIAFVLRFSGDIPNEFYKGLLLSATLITAIRIAYLWFMKIYLVPWRFFGLYEARKIFYTHIFTAVTFLAIFFLMDIGLIFKAYWQDVFVIHNLQSRYPIVLMSGCTNL